MMIDKWFEEEKKRLELLMINASAREAIDQSHPFRILSGIGNALLITTQKQLDEAYYGFLNDPTNLLHIGQYIGLLQDYIYSDNYYQYDHYPLSEFYENKVEAAKWLAYMASKIDDDIFHLERLAIIAQASVFSGDLKNAILCYTKLLESSEILPSDYNSSYYTGEFDAAIHIVHNLCVLYGVLKETDKVEELRQKYNYIFQLEAQRIYRIISRYPDDDSMNDTMKQELNALFINNDVHNFYIDTTLQGSRSGKMMLAIHSDQKKTRKRCIPLYSSMFNQFIIGPTWKGMLITEVSHCDYRLVVPLKQEQDTGDDLNKSSITTAPEVKGETEHKTEADSFEELNSLIGLNTIKADVNQLVSLMKVQERRKKLGLKTVATARHLVFTGNPGTGKTTVARILANIYREIGILSKGQLVEVGRSDLVAGYVGQTAIKTQEKINEALGGILFIDEAYTLAKDGNDFGQETIDTLLKAMEDYRDDFIVIVAGYPTPINQFIHSNLGLESRFNKYIHFDDYSVAELIEIFLSMCKKYDYKLTDMADSVMREKITQMEANKTSNFANARAVRNLFETVTTNQASRVVDGNDEELLTITELDFDCIE